MPKSSSGGKSESRARTEDGRRRLRVNWRYVASAGLAMLVLMALIFGWQQLEQFLITDSRFVLQPAAEYGEESPDLQITGLHYASRNQVLRVFQSDIGRSIYLFPLAERRKALLRIGWVKDASLVRTWPHHIAVNIVERKPAAFVQLLGDGINRWGLIDSDGIILDPPLRAPFELPVITGVPALETAAKRGIRVRRMSRLMEDIGGLRDKVSEVDVADLDDLKVTLKMKDHAVVLMLGDRNFRTRFQNFVDHSEEIERRTSNMALLDLRLDDRITVVGGTPR